jgi:hypothetical protein
MGRAQAHHLSEAGVVGPGMNDICGAVSFTSFLVHEPAVRVYSYLALWMPGFSLTPVSAGRWGCAPAIRWLGRKWHDDEWGD